MVIDKESHRVALLQLIEQSTVPGSQIDAAYELKQAIVSARCFDQPADPAFDRHQPVAAPNLRDRMPGAGAGHDASGDRGRDRAAGASA